MVKIFDATWPIVPAVASIPRGRVLNRLFLEHPRSIGESYFEHQRHALGFGLSLLLAALACFVHAIVPALFVRTGSSAVTRLHDRMVVHRAARGNTRVLQVRNSQPMRP
jgi:Family of unknown function (DUF6356)